ncbi:hypothetical protein KQI42_16775 [Tissierella sp. MSJ-40]|uniref:Transglutaminase-like domain-containing protein n=1 Tax=Tissierella simiarum TaxID=2841534 RepID=A0ABS6EAW5_9FIRM|nr:transglutaminase domain-containing protein [Tissierella simiarum]MBU5439671.1 hypothetical protein [Tissierella simiarum]
MGKKLFKILLAEILIILMLFTSYYFYNNKDKFSFNIIPSSSLKKSLKNEIVKEPQLYDELENALIEGKGHINIKGMAGYKNSDQVFKVIEEIVINNPEIMYYTGTKYFQGVLTPSYSKTNEEILNHQEEIRKARDKFISEYINSSMTDYEKVKAVHDYIVNNAKYDKRLFETGEVPPESYVPYGVLVLGVGVCEGYAKAMKYLLDEVQVKSLVVVGKSKGQNHAWNIVEIEGEHYHVDPTWDDPITDDGSNILSYDYFNLSDDQISKTHSWNREKYPVCNNDKFNYFVYNDLIINDKKEFDDKLKDVLIRRKKSFEGKITNFDKKDFSIEDSIENIVWSNPQKIRLTSYTYYLNKENGSIKFDFKY